MDRLLFFVTGLLEVTISLMIYGRSLAGDSTVPLSCTASIRGEKSHPLGMRPDSRSFGGNLRYGWGEHWVLRVLFSTSALLKQTSCGYWG